MLIIIFTARLEPQKGRNKHIYSVAQSIKFVWNKFDIETVTIPAIHSRISFFLKKYRSQKQNSKAKQQKPLDYTKVPDFKKKTLK